MFNLERHPLEMATAIPFHGNHIASVQIKDDALSDNTALASSNSACLHRHFTHAHTVHKFSSHRPRTLTANNSLGVTKEKTDEKSLVH